VTLELKPADIILVRGNTFIGDVIEDVTGSAYSHVAGFYDGWQIIEAELFSRVRAADIQPYKERCDIMRCKYLEYDQRWKIVAFAFSKLGARYSYSLVVWEAVKHLLNITLPINVKNTYICSTLWRDAYKSVGIDLTPGIKYPTPGDIARSKLLRKVGTY
jgi:uncharacterized protein YycO